MYIYIYSKSLILTNRRTRAIEIILYCYITHSVNCVNIQIYYDNFIQ